MLHSNHSSFTSDTSHLTLYIGCMYSGKTTSLLNEIHRISALTNNILIINSSLDSTRTSESFTIQTHSNASYPAIAVNNLTSLFNQPEYSLYSRATHVFIDEGQFFCDLYPFISKELKETTKHFFVAGLSGDFKLEPIGDILRLIPLADDLFKLSAYCAVCADGTRASFSRRNPDSSQYASDDVIVVGGKDIYAAVCRKHHPFGTSD